MLTSPTPANRASAARPGSGRPPTATAGIPRPRVADRVGPHQPPDAAQVVDRGLPDVHPRVDVVGPVDRDLVDPQRVPFGEDEQLGVEEPRLVLDHRQEDASDVGPDRLEPALGVGEAVVQGRSDDEVVTPGDELPLRSANDPRAASQPGPDGDVAVARQERRHQRQQRVEPGRQVDVHVGDDGGVAGHPGGPQRPTAALFIQVDGPDTGDSSSQAGGDLPRAVGAGVVGDGDGRVERERRVEEPAQAQDARFELGLFVVDRDDDLDARRPFPARPMAGDGFDGAHVPSLRSVPYDRLWPGWGRPHRLGGRSSQSHGGCPTATNG